MPVSQNALLPKSFAKLAKIVVGDRKGWPLAWAAGGNILNKCRFLSAKGSTIAGSDSAEKQPSQEATHRDLRPKRFTVEPVFIKMTEAPEVGGYKPMVQITDAQSELVTQLLAGLDEAIASVDEIEPTYANKTKVQKLLYLAIDEFDIPVTYSWYLAGAVVPDRSIAPSSLDVHPDSPVSPSEPNIAEPADSSVGEQSSETNPIDPIMFRDETDESELDSSADDLESYVSKDELVDFYRDILPEVWHQETMRFLQNFYQEEAPTEYRLLYIESTHLRTHLAELIDTVETHLNGEKPDRGIDSLRKSIELSISDLHHYIRADDQLRETFDVVVAGTDLIEDTLLKLNQLHPDDFTDEHLSLLRDLQDFFYYYVWKYPCLLLSHQTAIGPQADELSAERYAEFESFDEQVIQRRDKLERELTSAGLRPALGDYAPPENQELSETLRDLSSQYLE